jgi:hypothetical protein
MSGASDDGPDRRGPSGHDPWDRLDHDPSDRRDRDSWDRPGHDRRAAGRDSVKEDAAAASRDAARRARRVQDASVEFWLRDRASGARPGAVPAVRQACDRSALRLDLGRRSLDGHRALTAGRFSVAADAASPVPALAGEHPERGACFELRHLDAPRLELAELREAAAASALKEPDRGDTRVRRVLESRELAGFRERLAKQAVPEEPVACPDPEHEAGAEQVPGAAAELQAVRPTYLQETPRGVLPPQGQTRRLAASAVQAVAAA